MPARTTEGGEEGGGGREDGPACAAGTQGENVEDGCNF